MNNRTIVIIIVVIVSTLLVLVFYNEKRNVEPHPCPPCDPCTDRTDSAYSVRVIELLVDTDDITSVGGKWEQYVSFKGQKNESLEDFTTDVGRNDIVVWIGKSTQDPTDTVQIHQIRHKRGPNLFNKRRLNGKKGIAAGKIKGDVKVKDVQDYILIFKINNGRSYPIDPKLRVNH